LSSTGLSVSKSSASTRSRTVLGETAEMWRYATKAGIAAELKTLHHPRPARFLAAAILDWGLIILSTGAVLQWGWIASPLAIFVIGNRQRALGNLLHDASHWSMDVHRKRAAGIANVLFCWPLSVSMPVYRREHNQHHRFLGNPAYDPDFIQDEGDLRRGPLAVWWGQVRSWPLFREAVFGNFGRMKRSAQLGVAAWWIVVLGLVARFGGVYAALVFGALWLVSKATVFHGITAFREISDHVGLTPGSLVGFSRNHPFQGWLGPVFHPHNNGYHLLHHLTPGIPFHAIPRAHELLESWPPYAAGEQCRSYFSGRNSAVASWVERWS